MWLNKVKVCKVGRTYDIAYAYWTGKLWQNTIKHQWQQHKTSNIKHQSKMVSYSVQQKPQTHTTFNTIITHSLWKIKHVKVIQIEVRSNARKTKGQMVNAKWKYQNILKSCQWETIIIGQNEYIDTMRNTIIFG
jgi:hypothetical protein